MKTATWSARIQARRRDGVSLAPLLLVLTLLLNVPGRGHAAPLRQQMQQVAQLLEQWREQEAARALAPLARSRPGHPQVLLLQGELLFRQGDYGASLRVLKEAARLDPASPQIKAVHDLVASTQSMVKDHAVHLSSGRHFRIWTARGADELLVPFAGETLEAIRRAVKQDLGYAPADAVRVEVYQQPEDLARVSSLPLKDIKRSGTIALCKYNRLMIVSPRALPRGYPWRDTLAHEYMHLVISRMSHNTVPIWLHEGLAKYFEARWRRPSGAALELPPSMRHQLAEAQRSGRFIDWARMHPSMAKLPSQEATSLAFAQVHTAMDFISARARQQGQLPLAGLRKMLELMRGGKTDWQALKQVTGMPAARFTRGWRRHLRTLNLRPLPGLVHQRRRFGKRRSWEKRLAAVRQKKARDYLRLAGMLRARALPRAAIIEYLKARTLLGPRDDLVANHLARAYLEISSPAQAISALLPVLEYYPGLPGPQVTMGIAYLRSGDQRSAVKHLQSGLRINPFAPEIHCGLARALATSHKQRAALHKSLCGKLSR